MCSTFKRCAHAYWMLIGACNPMLCPFHFFRYPDAIATLVVSKMSHVRLTTSTLLFFFDIVFVDGANSHPFLSSVPPHIHLASAPHTRCDMLCVQRSARACLTE